MSQTRTDPHRPGAIIPSDYTYVLWYALATEFDGWPSPSQNVGLIVAMRGDPTIKWAPTGTTGKCSVCGACYLYGEIWRHDPTGEHIHIGHDCADKYSLFTNRAEWERWHREQTALRSQAAKQKRFKMAALRFTEAHPDLADAFALVPEAWATGEPRPVEILRDLLSKLNKYGSLSPAQVAFALRLADQVRNPPTKQEELHVPAPTGRTAVEGTVVSIKEHSGDWGTCWKMTVKVQTEAGSWLVWCTVPQAIYDAFQATDAAQGLPDWLRGRTVAFTAALQPGKDPHFAFGKRPTQARVL